MSEVGPYARPDRPRAGGGHVTVLEAAYRLAEVWPTAAMTSPETGLPICIETTRHVVEAFHAAGVPDVRPLPCALFAFNREATAQVLGGDKVDGACRVEVRPDLPSRRGWPGHLVVDHPEFILDLVLPAVIVSTRAKGFDGLGALCGEKGNELVMVDGAWMAITPDGLCVRYEPRPRVAGWRNTAAWRGDVDRLVVDRIVEVIGRVL